MDEDTNNKPVIPGQSQITINKKWVGIIVATLVIFVVGVGWMYQVVATARPLSAQYLQEHPRK